MKMKHFGTFAVASFLLSGAQALAATIVIDTFNTDQLVADASPTTTSLVTGGDIIGGTRVLTAENTKFGTDPTFATSLSVGNGLLGFSNNAAATGRGTLFYNGGGLGLGNLVAGENSRIFFDVAFFDNDANVDITVNGVDGNNNMISYMENVAGGNFDPFLTFTQFANGQPFDFTNVASLEFIVDTTNLGENIDGILDSLTIVGDDLAPIPLPASALLLLGGIGGLGGLRALRVRKKA